MMIQDCRCSAVAELVAEPTPAVPAGSDPDDVAAANMLAPAGGEGADHENAADAQCRGQTTVGHLWARAYIRLKPRFLDESFGRAAATVDAAVVADIVVASLLGDTGLIVGDAGAPLGVAGAAPRDAAAAARIFPCDSRTDYTDTTGCQRAGQGLGPPCAGRFPA
jgi:hypothetical protein